MRYPEQMTVLIRVADLVPYSEWGTTRDGTRFRLFAAVGADDPTDVLIEWKPGGGWTAYADGPIEARIPEGNRGMFRPVDAPSVRDEEMAERIAAMTTFRKRAGMQLKDMWIGVGGRYHWAFFRWHGDIVGITIRDEDAEWWINSREDATHAALLQMGLAPKHLSWGLAGSGRVR